MKTLRALIYVWICLQMAAFCQTDETGKTPTAPQPVKTELPDDGVRVSVLGYHDFSETEPETEMRIRTSKFREQLQAIRDRQLAVIPMADFIAWKKGEKTIPKKSVVITIDDGWKSVYTEAYPILKEFNYPFTIYLYRNYVDGGNKALSTPMIREMLNHGANLGCHSTSHPYPQTVKAAQQRGPDEFDQFLEVEMNESKRFLERKFAKTITTYAYPGGFFTDEMLTKAKSIGYTHLFTVLPGKVTRNLPDNTLPRYVILGNYDKIFNLAMDFGDSIITTADGQVVESIPKALEFPVIPQPGAIINSRMPNIEVDFTKAQNINPATLKMQVSGFGQVPANYASAGKLFSWQVNRRLRNKTCTVKVTWNDLEGKPTAKPLEWSFQIDRDAAYLPEEP